MTAICNNCQQLIPFSGTRGAKLKDQKCACGSTNLSIVSGRMNGADQKWDYYNRKGTLLKSVPFEKYPKESK